jgi:hypothetical protein
MSCKPIQQYDLNRHYASIDTNFGLGGRAGEASAGGKGGGSLMLLQFGLIFLLSLSQWSKPFLVQFLATCFGGIGGGGSVTSDLISSSILTSIGSFPASISE